MIQSIIIVSCYCGLRYFRKHCFTSFILVKIQSIAEAFRSKILKWFWIQLRNQLWDSSTKILWFSNYDFKSSALMQMSVLYQNDPIYVIINLLSISFAHTFLFSNLTSSEDYLALFSCEIRGSKEEAIGRWLIQCFAG